MKKLILTLLILTAVSAKAIAQDCSELFISEYVEGSHNNKALEIYNPTGNTIDLTKYRITRWQNGSAPVPPPAQYSDTLKGTIGPNEVIVVAIDRRTVGATGQDTPVFAALQAKTNFYLSKTYTVSFSMSFNGDDALSLDKNIAGEWVPIDIFGKIGEQPKLVGNSRTIGWSDSFPHNNGKGTWYTIDKTLIRRASVKKGITIPPTFFNPKTQWKLNPENMFDSLQTHNCDCNKYPAKTNSISEVKTLILPNPANNFVTIIAPFEIKKINLYTLSGQLLISNSESNTVNGFRTAKINVANLKSGMYLVETVGIDSKTSTTRLVVE